MQGPDGAPPTGPHKGPTKPTGTATGAPKAAGCFFIPLHKKKAAVYAAATACRKTGLTPLFRDFHGALAPTARAGSHAGKPLLRKAFCGFAVHPQGAFSCPFGTIHLAPPNPIKASGGRSRAPPVARGARRKPSEQGSSRKTPRSDAARPLRTALRPPNPRGFFDRLAAAGPWGACGRIVSCYTKANAEGLPDAFMRWSPSVLFLPNDWRPSSHQCPTMH